jgi:hypothetical protein
MNETVQVIRNGRLLSEWWTAGTCCGLMCGAIPGFPLGDWVKQVESPVRLDQYSGRHCRQSITNHNPVLPTWLRCYENWRKWHVQYRMWNEAKGREEDRNGWHVTGPSLWAVMVPLLRTLLRVKWGKQGIYWARMKCYTHSIQSWAA